MHRILIILFFTISLAGCRSTDPVKAAQLNTQGLALASQNKHREAIECYRKAAAYKAIPDSMRSIYLTNVAMSYHTLEVNDSAKFYFAKSAALNRKKSCAYLVNMAYIALIDHDTEMALEMLKDAHRFRPENLTANNLLGLIYLGDYDETFHDPQKALRYNIAAYNAFEDDIAKSLLARNYYELNNTEKAIQLFRELNQKNPEIVSYLATLIMMEQELGNPERADELLQQLKQIDEEKYKELAADPLQPGTHNIVWNK
ncbi:MAG: tetratricopeptide repeat protein [Chitinophagaceae bacterium]|nr:MAG: tetratricopeptide repeat protein [Chitinophagaceae bacterium]